MTAINYKNEKPPNWDQIQKFFPDVEWDSGVLIAYGDTYYSKAIGTPDLIEHEKVHMQQQIDIGGAQIWWDKYCEDPKFRLSQEIPAYKTQLNYVYNRLMGVSRNERRKTYRDLLEFIAVTLSSEKYGNMITYNEVIKMLDRKMII